MALIRAATPEDEPFLREMLAVAATWRPGAPTRSIDEILQDPELAHYVAGWPCDGDVGVVAEEGAPVGAAWWRFLPAHDPGYGFVTETIPELSIGVVESARGRGIGTALLDALIAAAHRHRLGALSLSVEQDNPARRIYQRLGFVEVRTVGGARTMVLPIGT